MYGAKVNSSTVFVLRFFSNMNNVCSFSFSKSNRTTSVRFENRIEQRLFILKIESNRRCSFRFENDQTFVSFSKRTTSDRL